MQSNNPQSDPAFRLLGARATRLDLVSVVPASLPDAALCWVLENNQLYFFVRRPVTAGDPLGPLEIPAGNLAGSFGRWAPVISGGSLSFAQIYFNPGTPVVQAVDVTPAVLSVPSTVSDSSPDWTLGPGNLVQATYTGAGREFKVSAGICGGLGSGDALVQLHLFANTSSPTVVTSAATFDDTGVRCLTVDGLFAVDPGGPQISLQVSSTGPVGLSLVSMFFNISPV